VGAPETKSVKDATLLPSGPAATRRRRRRCRCRSGGRTRTTPRTHAAATHCGRIRTPWRHRRRGRISAMD
jgi:hypothetical protein